MISRVTQTGSGNVPRCSRSLLRSAWCRFAYSCIFRSEEHTSELQSLMRISTTDFYPDLHTLSLHDALPIDEKYLSELESSMRGVSTEADAVKLIANANQTRAYLQDLLKRSEATLQ